MARFDPDEIEQIDALWRALPFGHVWTGWSMTGLEPEEIWIYRRRAHWRRFPLRKTTAGYALFDETGKRVARAPRLDLLLRRIENIPGLNVVEAGQ